MNKIKCLFVDDELPAITILEKFASMTEELEVIATCNNAIRAAAILKENQIDLIFLDINMPVITGMEFIKELDQPPAFVFTTAYREYAIESYELDAIDYLLKPFGFERFAKAIEKYKLKHRLSPKSEEHIFFTINRINHKIVLNDILYLESLKDYTQIHTTTGKLTVRGNLSTTIQKLSSKQFLRIHRSYCIAINKIESYSQSEVTIKGINLPLGITYREAALELISKVL